MDSEESGKIKDSVANNTSMKTIAETRSDEKTHTGKEEVSIKENFEGENRRPSASIDDDEEGRRVKRRKEKDDHCYKKDEHSVKKDDHMLKNKNALGNGNNPKLNAVGITTTSAFMATVATTITTAATTVTTAAASSATTTTTTPTISETAENEDTFNSIGSPGPKVPPLKIVIPPVESEQGNRNGKTVARHHGGLPYVVVSNDESGAPSSAPPSSPNQNPLVNDEESASSTANLSNEEQRIQQRVLRSTHSNRITATLGSGTNTNNSSNGSDSNTNSNNNESGNHSNSTDSNSSFVNNTSTNNSNGNNNSSNMNHDYNVNSTNGGNNSAGVGNTAGNSSSSSSNNNAGDGDTTGSSSTNCSNNNENSGINNSSTCSNTSSNNNNTVAVGATGTANSNLSSINNTTSASTSIKDNDSGSSDTSDNATNSTSNNTTGHGGGNVSLQNNAAGIGDGVEHSNSSNGSETSGNSSPMTMELFPSHESTNSGSTNKDDGNNVTAKTKTDGNSGTKGGTKIEAGTATAMKVKTESSSSKTKSDLEDDKSVNNGCEMRGATTTDTHSKDVAMPVVELHPRKRKLKSKQEINHTTVETDHTIAFGSAPHPHEVPVTNCYQMFMDIRRQIDVKRKGLFPIQPKPPQGFKDYLMNRCTYTLAGNAIPRLKRRNAEPPEGIDERLKDLYQDQEAERYSLRMQHVVEKEKLVLSVEQEILRVHGRAARALANQALPFSACTILKDEEVYNVITPEQEEKDRNARSRYNGRLFISWLQDVDDKWEKIKEEMLARHHKEAESLNAVQKFNWDLKMRQLGLWKKQKLAPVDDSHVPMISVSDDFDLLPE